MSVYSDYRHACTEEEREFLRGVMRREAARENEYPEYDWDEEEEEGYDNEKSNHRQRR